MSLYDFKSKSIKDEIDNEYREKYIKQESERKK